MADFNASTWSEIPSDNDATAPNGFPTGQNPNTLPDSFRVLAAAGKNHFDNYNAMYATTGTATALVLTRVAAPTEGYQKGLRFTFFPNATNTGAMTLNINSLGAKSILRSDGSAPVAGDVTNGLLTEVYYDGTAFRLINSAGNVYKGDGSALTNLNGSAITSGTVADVRLPTSMAGKTFTTAVNVGAPLTVAAYTHAAGGEAFRINSSDTTTGKPGLSFFKEANTTRWTVSTWDGASTAGTIDLQSTNLRHNGQTVWTAANFDPNTKANLTGATFSGPITLSGVGTNSLSTGTGDNATYSTYNFALNGWYGMGMKSGSDNAVNGVYNFRTGAWDTKGGFFKNGVSAVFNDGGTWGINVTGTSGNSNALGGRASNTFWDWSVNGWKSSSEGQQRRYYASGGRNYFDSGTGEGYQSTFRYGNVDKLHIGSDGNIWMAWANDWMSNLLNSKVTQDNYAAYWNINVSGSSRLLQLGNNGTRSSFNWNGQAGQPQWLWGGNDPANMYVYNPSNFSVNYANNAGAVGGVGINGLAQVYGGTWNAEPNYPIGHQIIVVCDDGVTNDINSVRTIRLRDNGNFTTRNTGTVLSGIWRNRGGWTQSSQRFEMFQRMA